MGTRNTITDLHNALFEELERLSDEDLTEDELKLEISRSKAITGVAANILDAGNLALKVAEFKEGAISEEVKVPHYLEA